MSNPYILTKTKIDTDLVSRILEKANEKIFRKKLEINFLPDPQNLWCMEYISSSPPWNTSDCNIWTDRMLWLEEPNKLELTSVGRKSPATNFSSYLELVILNQLVLNLPNFIHVHFPLNYALGNYETNLKKLPSYQEYIENSLVDKKIHKTVIGSVREKIYSLSPPEFQTIKSKYPDWEICCKELTERGYAVIKAADYKYSINSNSHGIVDYYPKSNRLMIRKSNKWLDNGFLWIKDTFANVN